jgi:hypothetical protein
MRNSKISVKKESHRPPSFELSFVRSMLRHEQPQPASPAIEPVQRPFLGQGTTFSAKSPLLYPQPDETLVDDDAFFGGIDHPTLVTDEPWELDSVDEGEEGADFAGDSVHTEGVPRCNLVLDAR